MKTRKKEQGTGEKPAAPLPTRAAIPSGRGPVVVFSALLGIFFGLCLLKFANPPIMEKYVETPQNGVELLISTPWPIHWAYGILTAIAVSAVLMTFFSQSLRVSVLTLLSSFRRTSPLSVLTLVLPVLWLLWEALAKHHSVRHELSAATFHHYIVCVACFYLGVFVLGRLENPWPFLVGLLCGVVLVVAIGLDQHFGGLAESRAYFYRQQELYPGKEIPPEFVKRMASTRIYSTLFYPNTLAGALILLFPTVLVAIHQSADRWRLGNASRMETLTVLFAAALGCIFLYLLNTHLGWVFLLLLALALIFPVPRWVAPAILSLGVLGVLFWSGSKAGWLIVLLLATVALWRLPFNRRTQLTIIGLLLVVGLAGFFVKYSTFFKKGATSVSARFDYWRAAVETTRAHPLLGTGPGTFQIPYEQIKRPEAEMTRLVHNDYLEEASDSGIPGFLLYTAFIVGALVATRPAPGSYWSFAIWLGVCGWATQCLVEFSLHIPALAWPAFGFIGYLCGQKGKSVENEQHSTNSQR